MSTAHKSQQNPGALAAAAAAAGGGGGAAATTITTAASVTTAATASQLAAEYVKLLDAVGTPNYETIESLFAGYGCPPASTIPAIQVSFELFEAVQNRFAATKQVLERTKADLLNRNQQYTIVHQDLHRVQEEYEVLRKRNIEAEERNTELHQQRAKLEVSVEQLRREVGQGRTALDALRHKLVRREEELQVSQSRVAENLVALSQKDAVVTTLRRELMKKGPLGYGVNRGETGRRTGVEAVDGDAERDSANDGDEDNVDADGAAAQDAYTADMLENIAADVEGRAQEARMKLSLAELESRLSRLQEEKESVLTQHTQYRQHVQLSLQSYEADAMLREDAMGGHVCLRTPYFDGEQQAMYATILNLQTGERLPHGAESAKDGNEAAGTAGATTAAPTLPSFAALGTEMKRIVDRFAKVRLDDDSRLHGGLSLCVSAQQHALQAGADLVGFLTTMEDEVLHRRLTLPEVREEWKKAGVSDFAQAVAAALRDSASELGKGVVGLLEQENAMVAEIEAAKASAKVLQPPRKSSFSAADAASATSASTINDASTSKSKRRSQHGAHNASVSATVAEHVSVGVMARPAEPRQDVSVQVETLDFPAVNTAGAASTDASISVRAPSPPVVVPGAAKESKAEASSRPPSTQPPRAAEDGGSSIPTPTGKGGAAPDADAVSSALSERQQHTKANPPASADPSPSRGAAPVNTTPAKDVPDGVAVATDAGKPLPSPVAVPTRVKLIGVCPNCAFEVPLTNNPSPSSSTSQRAQSGGFVPPVSAVGVSADGIAGSTAASLHELSLSGGRPVSAGSPPPSGVALPSAVNVPASDATAVGKGAGWGGTTSLLPSSVHSGVAARPPTAEVLHYQQQLTTATEALSEAQRANAELRERLAQALAAATAVAAAAAAADGTNTVQGPRDVSSSHISAVNAEGTPSRSSAETPLEAATSASAPPASHHYSHMETPKHVKESREEAHPAASPLGGAVHTTCTPIPLSDAHAEAPPSLSANVPSHVQDQQGRAEIPSTGDLASDELVKRSGSGGQWRANAEGAEGGLKTVATAEAPETSPVGHRESRRVPDADKNTSAAIDANGSDASRHPGRYTPSPPLLPRVSSTHTASPASATDSRVHDAAATMPVSGQPGPAAPSSILTSSPRMTAESQQTASSTAGKKGDEVRWEEEEEEEDAAATLSPSSHNDSGILGDSARPAPSSGVPTGRLPQPPTSTSTSTAHFTAPPTTSYLGTALNHSTTAPSFNLDLVITGTRRLPGASAMNTASATSTRWAAADRSSAASSQLLHRSLMSVGSTSSNNASVVAATGTTASTKRPTSVRSIKRTASKMSSFARGKPGGVHAEQKPQPLPSKLSPPLPPLKASSPLSAQTDDSPLGAASFNKASLPPASLGMTQPLSSPMPKRLALPAIHTSDGHDATSATPSVHPIDSHRSEEHVGGDDYTAPSAQDYVVGRAVPGVGNPSKFARADGSSVEGAERGGATQHHDTSVKAAASATFNAEQKSLVLQALLAPSLPQNHQKKRQSTMSPAPAKLTTRQELQLIYQVLRLRSSLSLRNGAGARWWQQTAGIGDLGSSRRYSYASLGINGNAMTVGTLARGNNNNPPTTSGRSGAGYHTAARNAEGIEATTASDVPSGCVSRPLILRRVRSLRRVGSRGGLHVDDAGDSLSFFTKGSGYEWSSSKHHNGESNTHAATTEQTRPSTQPSAPLASGLAPQPGTYRYYLSTPAEVPRRWSTGQRLSYASFGASAREADRRVQRVPRTWQQQRRHDHAQLRQKQQQHQQRRAQTPPGHLAVHGLSAMGGLTFPPRTPLTLSAPLTLAQAKDAPPFPSFISPFPFGPNANAFASTWTPSAARTADAAPLQPIAAHMLLYRRVSRRPTRAVMLRAKRDPGRRAVKRNVYTSTAPPEAQQLPSHHDL